MMLEGREKNTRSDSKVKIEPPGRGKRKDKLHPVAKFKEGTHSVAGSTVGLLQHLF
jgi:hypothetical protein